MCEITVNGSRRIDGDRGRSLLDALHGQGIPLPSVCGGRGLCGTCKLKVLKGGGPYQPAEMRLLSGVVRADGVRLACQVKIDGDIGIEIPEGLFGVRKYHARCAKTEDLTYDTKRFRFELSGPETIGFVAGQYVQLLCPAYKQGVGPVERAYSIASDPKERDFIDLIIRKVPGGVCTTWCFEHLKQGDAVEMTGPYGQFGLTGAGGPTVFIAGSSGIAPFVSILHQMKNNADNRKTELFFGGNTEKDLCLFEEMEQFERELGGFTFIPVAARPQDNWKGQTGLVTEAVKRRYADLSGYEGYLCGGPAMVDAAINVLKDLKMPEEKIFYDKY